MAGLLFPALRVLAAAALEVDGRFLRGIVLSELRDFDGVLVEEEEAANALLAVELRVTLTRLAVGCLEDEDDGWCSSSDD